MEGHIERVLDAARTAPSYDNLQPWRFTVEGETVAFGVDHERDPSPDGVMARIAVGAAIECACVAAARMGATVRFGAPREGSLVTMSITDPKRVPEPDLARTRRVTNRRLYDGRAFDDVTAHALQKASPTRDLAQTHWFGRERVRVLGPLFEEAEELLYLDDGLRERTLSAIRFGNKDREEVATGLSLGSLELSAAERAALVGFRKAFDPRVASADLKRIGARARRLVESASGVCIITTTGTDPMADVDAGRSMQRAWMALTQRGLAAQPMTAMMALGARAERGGEQLDPRIPPLLASFRRTFPNVSPSSRVVFLMRFGWAPAPSCRVGRLPLEQSLTATSPAG
jgi:nitroreductase